MSVWDRADYWASKEGVDPGLYRSLIRQESGGNPNAMNPGTHAFGLSQALPSTAASPGFGVAPLSPGAGADDQLRFGAQYLDAMLDRYHGDVTKGLAAYNWGPGNADKWSGSPRALPAETHDYISSILAGVPQTVDMPAAGLGDDAAPDEPPTGLAALMPRRTVGEGENAHIAYGDNALGHAAEGIDNFRKKLGINEHGGHMVGNMLQNMGMQMMGL